MPDVLKVRLLRMFRQYGSAHSAQLSAHRGEETDDLAATAKETVGLVDGDITVKKAEAIHRGARARTGA